MIKIKHTPAIYFAHIDGLRAIAVLAVVFSHLLPNLMPGGYVGVDVFFVISGYLITGILIREMKNKSFTFGGFYERRARRIFPALFAVLICTLVGSYILLLPSDFNNTLRGGLGTLFFASNIVFWKDLALGYFAAMSAELNPLVHTWSLAVEEQFYVIFPILLIVLYKIKPQKIALILAGFFIISLIGTELFVRNKSVAVFFLSPFRAWELLAGGLLVFNLVPPLHSRVLREFVAGLGLLAILISCFFYSDNTIFPGLTAVLPVLGSAAIIHAGSSGRSLVTRILEVRPVVYVGLISYSLYLWHWPLIVLSRYAFPMLPLTAYSIIALFVTSLFLASISYHFIEQPFRGKLRFTRLFVFSSSAVIVSILSVFCIFGILKHGYENRFNVDVVKFDKARSQELIYKKCDNLQLPKNWCTIGSSTAPKKTMLIGDSHLISWAPVLDKVLQQRGEQAILAMLSNCPPMIGVVKWGKRHTCPDKSTIVQNYIVSHPEIKTIIIIGFWSPYFKDNVPLTITTYEGYTASGSGAAHKGLTSTLQWLQEKGKNTILFGPVPVYEKSVPMLQALGLSYNRNFLLSNKEEQLKKNGTFIEVVNYFKSKTRFHYLDPIEWMCKKECITMKAGVTLYLDSNHLNFIGAMDLEDKLANELELAISKNF